VTLEKCIKTIDTKYNSHSPTTCTLSITLCDDELPVSSSVFSLLYFSSPLLRILYFSWNSACFCLRISCCFLTPFTLEDKTESMIKSTMYNFLKKVQLHGKISGIMRGQGFPNMGSQGNCGGLGVNKKLGIIYFKCTIII